MSVLVLPRSFRCGGALDSSSITFAVEQPELHVHPAVQVALGDLFIDAIKLRDHRTMLIETHSRALVAEDYAADARDF